MSEPTNVLLEKLAAEAHEQWMVWSKKIAEEEKLTPERLERWQKLWVPYDQLTEEQKEADRERARKILGIIIIYTTPK
jgi:hypothetical protein